jgi:hypothetical protein
MAIPEIQSHHALEAMARRCRWEKVNVRSFDGSGRLADLSFTENGTSLGAKCHAASATTFEVYYS